MGKWIWVKHDFTKLWKKHPQIARYSYMLMDERGFARGQVVYFPSSKKYVVYSKNTKWGAWDDKELGNFRYLSDAKRTLEADWGKRITRARKNTDWHPFGL